MLVDGRRSRSMLAQRHDSQPTASMGSPWAQWSLLNAVSNRLQLGEVCRFLNCARNGKDSRSSLEEYIIMDSFRRGPPIISFRSRGCCHLARSVYFRKETWHENNSGISSGRCVVKHDFTALRTHLEEHGQAICFETISDIEYHVCTAASHIGHKPLHRCLLENSFSSIGLVSGTEISKGFMEV